MGGGELHDVEIFFFTENWIFESVFYKGAYKRHQFFLNGADAAQYKFVREVNFKHDTYIWN